MAGHGCTPHSLSSPEAYMWLYQVYRVLIVALGPTSGEAVNPQVGLTSFSPT
jgi:hypothetical protein